MLRGSRCAETSKFASAAAAANTIYNLSPMSRRDAERLLQDTEGRVCTHFYRRNDGTILTSDCPVGFGAKVARFRRRANLAFSGLFSIAAAFAQAPQPAAPLVQIESSAKPALSGVVKDQTGAPLPGPSRNGTTFPGAEITVLDLKSGREFKTKGDQSGAFQIANLEKATYRVKVSMPGFSTWSKDVALSNDSPTRIEVVLMVGTVGGPVPVVEEMRSKLPDHLK